MVHLTKSDFIKMQIKRVEKEIRDTPYHKATEHHIGRLRAKLAKLKDQEIESVTKKGGAGGGYGIKKQGDATMVLVGPPSVGKSTLLNKLTNAKSKVAPYEFTTVSVIPGMMTYRDARIQILDVPGLIEGAEKGKGRGREVLSVVRGCDLLVIMTDYDKVEKIKEILQTLENNGIRINKDKPQIIIDKKLSGSIIIHSNIKQDLSKEIIESIIDEMGVKNAEVTIKQKITVNNLTDALSRNRVYIPAIFVVNKIDLSDVSRTGSPVYRYVKHHDINQNYLNNNLSPFVENREHQLADKRSLTLDTARIERDAVSASEVRRQSLCRRGEGFRSRRSAGRSLRPGGSEPEGYSECKLEGASYISVRENLGIDQLKESIWNSLKLVRIYLVRKGEDPSKNNPLIMKEGGTLADVSEKIGEEFAKRNQKAQIWGPGAKYPGQEVSLSTSVKEGMTVRFI